MNREFHPLLTTLSAHFHPSETPISDPESPKNEAPKRFF